MNIVLSSTVLASVLSPAFSFSYLDNLGSANPAPAGSVDYNPFDNWTEQAAPVAPAAAEPAPSNGASYLDALSGPAGADNKDYNPFDNWTEEQAAPAAPAAAAPAAAAPAASYQSGFSDVGEIATTSAGYLESVHTSEGIHGPGIMTHVDTLNTGASLIGGAGIHTYAENLPVANAFVGGAGINTYCDNLSPSADTGASYSPFGSSASPATTFSGETSADGVSFTLETGDISGLAQNLSTGGTLRLTGSIDSISYN